MVRKRLLNSIKKKLKLSTNHLVIWELQHIFVRGNRYFLSEGNKSHEVIYQPLDTKLKQNIVCALIKRRISERASMLKERKQTSMMRQQNKLTFDLIFRLRLLVCLFATCNTTVFVCNTVPHRIPISYSSYSMEQPPKWGERWFGELFFKISMKFLWAFYIKQFYL